MYRIILASLLLVNALNVYSAPKKGGDQNNGRAQLIEVVVDFGGSFGSTITDDSGTYFNINYNEYQRENHERLYGIPDYDPYNGVQVWRTTYDPKVYIDEYHFGDSNYDFASDVTIDDVRADPDAGVPLYLFGRETGITVSISNKGSNKATKLRVTSESFSMQTDGTNGASFGNQTSQVISIPAGETVVIDASYFAEQGPGIEPGLNRFSIVIAHANKGKSGKNPGLIKRIEAIFCPPEYEAIVAGELLLD